jgi:hypothetical protein
VYKAKIKMLSTEYLGEEEQHIKPKLHAAAVSLLFMSGKNYTK